MDKKYLHILSFDGLSKVDIEKMKKMPAFSEFYKNASGSDSVKSVYPSLTYCAHTSITTGVYPNKHGIVNNTLIQPNRFSPDWYWYDRDIKCDTFQKVASNAGYSILSIFWPVTAASKYIKYNMPEIFANRKWKNQIMVSLLNGTPGFQYNLNKRFGYLRDGHKEPELDNFSHASFLYSLENYKSEINMVHYIDLDSQRHEYGFDSKEANDALIRLDKRLGEIVEKLKELEIYDDSVIVILGDHSSIDGHSNVYVNTLLERAGLLEKNNENLVKSYKVISKSSDGSCYIYAGEEVEDSVILDALNPLLENNIVEKIYTSKEAKELGADEKCRFMLEGSIGYFFKDSVEEDYVINVEKLRGKVKKLCVNNHGYNPNTKNNFETVFFVSGKGIKKNVYIDEMSLVDEGPTFAKIMGVELKDVDGRVLEELLEV